jgi:hypothetical protein
VIVQSKRHGLLLDTDVIGLNAASLAPIEAVLRRSCTHY